ncbi:MAG: Mov34/MPN/PAD-1 family protein [Candidatus Njordarchaeales archaeon]
MGHRALVIAKKELERLVKEAMESKTEICGVLLGTVDSEGKVIVKRVKRAKNTKESPVLFEIDPEDLYQAIVEGEQEGLDIVGLYHSHPGPPRPSKRDLEGMKLWPVPWLIISSLNGSYDCYLYILEENSIARIPVILK